MTAWRANRASSNKKNQKKMPQRPFSLHLVPMLIEPCASVNVALCVCYYHSHASVDYAFFFFFSIEETNPGPVLL